MNPIFKRIDEPVALSTVLQLDNELRFTLQAFECAVFRAKLHYRGSTSGDLRVGVYAPDGARKRIAAGGHSAGTTARSGNWAASGTASDFPNAAFGAQGTTPADDDVVYVDGIVRNGPNAGEVVIAYAQNTSHATPTIVLADSYLERDTWFEPEPDLFVDDDSGESARVTITVPAGKVASTLTNFPLYLDLSTFPAAFWSGVIDGKDLRARDASGANLPMGVRLNLEAQTGRVHILLPSLEPTGATVYLHYGNASYPAVPTDAPHGRNAVWADYELVYFFSTDDGWEDHTGKATRLRPAIGIGNVSAFAQTAVSGQTNSHQGVAFDGTHFYTFDTNAIRKWTAAWTLVATNSNPGAQIGFGVDHLGDGDVVDGIIYLPAQTAATLAGRIARFNASDLSFIDSIAMGRSEHGQGLLCYCPDDDRIYCGPQWSAESPLVSPRMWIYDRTTLACVGILPLSEVVPYVNGTHYWNGTFWFNADPPSQAKRTYRVTRDGRVDLAAVVNLPATTAHWEGLASDAGSLYGIWSGGTGNGTVYRLEPVRTAAGAGLRCGTNGLSTATGYALAHAPALTTWTLGVSVALRSRAADANAVSYGVNGNGDDAMRATVGYQLASDRFGLWSQADGWLTGSVAPALTTPYRLHAVHDGPSRTLYEQGALVGSQALGAALPAPSANALYIGTSDASLTAPLHGDVGFLYLRAGTLSADWIAAEVANLQHPGCFYQVTAS